MSMQMQAQVKPTSASVSTPIRTGLLQRKCARSMMAGDECEERSKKKRFGLQTKLKVNEPGDIYEQEADLIADQMMATPAHQAVGGAPPRIQRFAGQPTGQADAAPASVDHALASIGRPLDPALQKDMEQRFGHDFRHVRVHHDAKAAESAHALHARAYTVGQDVVFAANEFAPATHQGRELLAHELAHTVQQRGATAKEAPLAPGSALETQAEQASCAAAGGQTVAQSLATSGLAIARAPDRPSYLDSYTDEQLEEQARIYRVMLRRRPEYPEREKDVQFLTELTQEIERRKAISEAQAVLAPAAEEPEAEEPARVQMALSRPTKGRAQPPPPSPAPRRPPRPPSTFEPGGFTNEDIERPWKEAEERIKAETKPKDEPFVKRFYAARRQTTLADQANEVWSTGKNEGLFTEDERWAFDRLWEERIGKPAHEEAKAHARAESIQWEMAWEAHGEAMRSPEMIIQPFVVAAAAPELLASAYFGAQTGEMIAEGYNACVYGTKADCAAATAQLAAAVAAHRIIKGKSRASRPTPEGESVTSPSRQLPSGPPTTTSPSRQLPSGPPTTTSPSRQLPSGPPTTTSPSRQLPSGPPTTTSPSRQLPSGPPTTTSPSRQLPSGPPTTTSPSRQLPSGPPTTTSPSRQLPSGPPTTTSPSRQLPSGPPTTTSPSRQLPSGPPTTTSPSRQLPSGPPTTTSPSQQLPSGPPTGRIVEQEIKDPNIRVGSGETWTGKKEPPQWDNPKSQKAYGHIESTHGPKVKPDQFKGRLEKGAPEQGQWYNAEDWVLAEKLAGKNPGKYVIDFGRPIGRVYRAGSDTPVEGVTRAFVQRNPDGSLNSGYPVTDNFRLR